MILVLERATPRGVRGAVPLDLALDAGVHALVGTPSDGTRDLASLAGGLVPAGTGRVLVRGVDPGSDPALRGRIGVTLEVPQLPECTSVGDLFELVAMLRRGTLGGRSSAGDAARPLADFGLGHWQSRSMESLSRSERRTVELVLALSTPSPVALILTEPGADTAAIDREAVKMRMDAAAAGGALVLVVTASVADAVELANTVHMLDKGRIVRSVAAGETGALVPGRGIELEVEVDLPRLLVAQLADDPAVLGIRWGSQRSFVAVRGEHLDDVAVAVARAALAAGADVRSLAPVAPGLDEVRAASAGLAFAAYQAAHEAYRRYAAHGEGTLPSDGEADA
jgi:ABC-type multidrug transport system ATPase subunit